ncbi:membrane hypothetical protein [Gammaproteobacteria bacterium]
MKRLLLVLIVFGGLLETVWGSEVPNYPNTVATPPFFNANKAAFVTTTSLAVLTAASAMGATAAAKIANTFSLVSYSALAITSAAMSIAAITAWVSLGDNQSTADAGEYFQKVGEHSGVAVAGVSQFVSLILVQAVVQGLAQGTSRAISRSIGGEDHTVRMVR